MTAVKNTIQIVKKNVKEIISNAISASISNNEIPNISIQNILIETPKEKENGDFSTNIAMQITKEVHMAPKAIAQILINNMSLEGTYVERVSCANPGFINFYINNSWVYDNINCIQ